jgi:hypothetical protein
VERPVDPGDSWGVGEDDGGMDADLDTSSSDQLPPPPPPTADPTSGPAAAPPVPPVPDGTVPAPPGPGGRHRTGWHIAAIIAGCFMVLPSLGMLAGGTTLAIANSVATDDGYFDVTLDRLESDGVAVAAVDLWEEAAEDEDWPWVLDFIDLDIRLRVDGIRATDDVFVGIARSDDVEGYLDDAAFSELIDFDHRDPDYVEHGGAGTVPAPAEQDFWTASATGDGEQELTWEARNGRWSVVVMNADGTPGVEADVEVGVRSDVVTPIAVTLIVLGGIGTLAAIALIVVGARGRRT